MKNTYTKTSLYSLIVILAITTSQNAVGQCVISTSVSYQPTPNVCSGNTLTISATTNVSGVSYSWTGPNNYTNTSQNAVIPNVNSVHTGTYKVVVSKAGCSSDSDSVAIIVHTTPTPPLIPQTPICSGDTLKIDLLQFAKNASAIGWAPNGSSDTITFSPLTFPNALKHTHSGEYKVVVSNATCTSDTLRVIIPQHDIVYQPDTPVAGVNKTPLCSGDTLILSGSSGTAVGGYYWTGPNQQNYIAKDVTINGYSVVGKQQFILRTDSNGCFSVPDTLDIDVYPINNPKVSISASPSFIVSQNVMVTLTALPVDSGYNTQYQWRKNGVDMAGETSKTLSVVTSQDIHPGDLISVWIQSSPTCAAIDTALSNEVSVTITAGINDINKTSAVLLYPNPAKDRLVVKSEKEISSVQVTNITGTVIDIDNRQVDKNTIHINTSTLPQGVYLLKTDLGIQRFIKTAN